MPPKRSRIEPMVTRTKSKRQKQSSDDNTETATQNNNSSISQNDVISIVDAVISTMEKRGLVANTCAPPSEQNVTELPSSSSITNSTTEANRVHNEIDNGNPVNVETQVREIFSGGHNVHSHQPTVCNMPNPIAMQTVHNHTTPVIPGNANQTESISCLPRVRCQPCSCARTLASDLTPQARHIMNFALSDRTKAIYLQNWNTFLIFCNTHNLKVELPISEQNLVNYLAHLCTKGYKLSTISTHASSLAYINKYLGFKDFAESFLVKQLFKGIANLKTNSEMPDTRLPITHELLHKMLTALPHTIQNFYQRTLFATMCILAFHGFFRIGELCKKKANDTSSHAILFKNVKIIEQPLVFKYTYPVLNIAQKL